MTTSDNKEMTIDDLARMVKGGLDEVHQTMNQRFDQTKEEIQHLAATVDANTRALARIEGNYERRIERLEDNMRQVLMALKLT